MYSEEKIEHERKKKTTIVNSFIREFPNILLKLEKDVKRTRKIEYLTLYLLLFTHIRVGNLEYYHYYHHKGLTTLKKKDIKIKENNNINFKFIGKDGIPQNITKKFPEFIITQLKKLLSKRENNEFVFTDKNNRPFHSYVFSNILFEYTNKHFYPHIIRSFYADLECRKFINNHKYPTTRKKVLDKFKEIALDLGHKKYNKNKNIWDEDYKVTIDNYIRPIYVEKMKLLYKKR